MVNMGQIAVSRTPGDVLTALGLGSCIAVCAYDPVARVGGMIHVVLPSSAIGRPDDAPAKFADQGVPRLIADMGKQGGLRARLKIAMLGGANVLVSASQNGTLDIGNRNAAAVREALRSQGFATTADDIGGKISRTVRLRVHSGEVMVKTVRDGEALFACLRGASGQQ